MKNKILAFVFLIATFFIFNVCYAETYENFTYEVQNGKVIITGYNNTYSDKLVIPSKINNMNVETVGSKAFKNCTNIQSIVIPKTVTEIEQYAFQKCTNLIEVKILGNVTDLGFFVLYPNKDTIFNDGNKNLKVYCYEGTKIAQYVKQTGIDYSFIPKTDIAYAKATEVSNYMYTGSAIKPSISLTYNGETLLNNIDYTISYKNNVKVGTATITITGKGNYTGTKEITFKINPLNITKYTFSKMKNYT